MKLITKAIEQKMKKYPLYSQDGKGDDAEVIVKFFIPDAQATWLVTEAEDIGGGDYEFFGLATLNGYDWEYGYFRLSQLKQVRGRFGLPIERDLYAEGTIKAIIGDILN